MCCKTYVMFRPGYTWGQSDIARLLDRYVTRRASFIFVVFGAGVQPRRKSAGATKMRDLATQRITERGYSVPKTGEIYVKRKRAARELAGGPSYEGWPAPLRAGSESRVGAPTAVCGENP